MSQTILQKILEKHSKSKANVGDIIDVDIDVRAARDFGGANVVKNLEDNSLPIENPQKTFFTFDCNPGGCDQKYASNQHICRLFARRNNIRVFDIGRGIGTHAVIEEGIAKPGDTVVSTDSHANILGAIGAFGQGMGDNDVAHAFAYGRVWFKVPPTVKIVLKGKPLASAFPKDIVLKMLRQLGADGLLGYAAEMYGEYVDSLSLDGKITIASMATEMGGIILLFPSENIYADKQADYERVIEIDIDRMGPQISRPGHPEDVVDVSVVKGKKIDSGFIGSCTNGRIEDMRAAASILRNRRIAPGRVLKIVPATFAIWSQCLDEGLLKIFTDAGALVGSAGCAGCADGQIGQTGKDEVSVSTGNRNFAGKQGKGDIYLASPATAAASLVTGFITTANEISEKPVQVDIPAAKPKAVKMGVKRVSLPLTIEGRAWVIKRDNVDTDMIFHNRYLSITNIDEMGQYSFDNLKGYENFARQAKKGDIVFVGKNFGCGSSRQQAVDCFKSLGIGAIVAESFGAIYERNAINSAVPILVADGLVNRVGDGDEISIDFMTGEIKNKTRGESYLAKPFSKAQIEIYERGGLLTPTSWIQ
jgi:3-isopropylmalate/(R)-2-methylmalate dehydratase large subunit